MASDTIPEKTKEIYLKVISQGTHYDFYYSLKGEKDWTLLCKDVDASYLSTATAGGFTGSVIGLYAVCKWYLLLHVTWRIISVTCNKSYVTFVWICGTLSQLFFYIFKIYLRGEINHVNC